MILSELSGHGECLRACTIATCNDFFVTATYLMLAMCTRAALPDFS